MALAVKPCSRAIRLTSAAGTCPPTRTARSRVMKEVQAANGRRNTLPTIEKRRALQCGSKYPALVVSGCAAAMAGAATSANSAHSIKTPGCGRGGSGWSRLVVASGCENQFLNPACEKTGGEVSHAWRARRRLQPRPVARSWAGLG